MYALELLVHVLRRIKVIGYHPSGIAMSDYWQHVLYVLVCLPSSITFVKPLVDFRFVATTSFRGITPTSSMR